jgi:SpoVK/Ycf46/Vps4 family AAA+-type ATPase
MDYLEKIRTHISALTPLLYIGTYSPEVVREELKEMASSCDMNYHCVSLTDISSTGEDPLQTLDKIITTNKKNILHKRSLWVLYLYHLLLKDPDPLIIAKMRQLTETKTLNSTVIILGIPHFKLPSELSDIFQIDHTTVTKREILQMLRSSGDAYRETDGAALINGLAGVKSHNEAETLLALSMVTGRKGSFDAEFIMEEKKSLMQERSKNLFEVINHHEYGLDYIGGMDKLMDWIRVRIPLLKMKTWKYPHLSKPRGILLLGIPGGGKSFFAAAVGKSYEMPVVKLNPHRLFHSSLGETESNFLHVLESLESFHTPVVFFIDEIEKSFSRTDGSTDGNTSNRILALLLDFLSNHTECIFTIATCNSIGALPPELLRKGRFDEIFYIPFPDHEERRAICKAFCKKYSVDIPVTDSLVNRLKGFTGSEIEQVYRDTLYEALDRNMEHISEFNFVKQADNVVPLRVTMGEELDRLERWATNKCRWVTDRNNRP